MLTITKPEEGLTYHVDIEEDFNEFKIADAFYRFMILAGYDTQKTSEAFIGIGDNYSDNTEMQEILSERFAMELEREV